MIWFYLAVLGMGILVSISVAADNAVEKHPNGPQLQRIFSRSLPDGFRPRELPAMIT